MQFSRCRVSSDARDVGVSFRKPQSVKDDSFTTEQCAWELESSTTSYQFKS